MGNVLNLATSGLLAFQRAITTTGNNITNANTEGYSRQSVHFGTQPSLRFGPNYFGNGVNLRNIERIADDLLGRQIQSHLANNSDLKQFHDLASQLDSYLSGANTSVASSIQSFFDSMHNLSENPDYTPARQNFLTQTELLVSRVNSMATQLNDFQIQINNNIIDTVDSINSLANNIAVLNKQIVGGTSTAPELLDQREVLLNHLAELTNISVIQQDDGALNVSIGRGITLVLGANYTPLSTSRNTSNLSQYEIATGTSNPATVVTNSIDGGRLGGLIKYREQILDPVTNGIGRIALALTSSINTQHKLGMDSNSALGVNFFNDMNANSAQLNRVESDTTNTGSAVLRAEITDASQLTTSNYQLKVNTGPSYSLVRLSDNTTTTFSSFPQTVDGFTLHLDSGTAAVGDNFLIAPTRNAGAELALNVTDTNKIALAAPIATMVATANKGSGKISPGVVTDTTNSAFTTTPGQLSPPIRIRFLSGTSYQIENATTSAVIEGPLTYDPNVSNVVFPTAGSYDPGYRVNLSGAVQDGDIFNISYNINGVGDNRNAMLMTDIQAQRNLNNGLSNMQGAYGAMIADVGSRTNQAKSNLDASEILLDQSVSRRESLSGVNIDEEASNLLKYEQAYQAATKIISVAANVFNELLDSMR